MALAPGARREMFTSIIFSRNLSTKRLTPTIALITNDNVSTQHLRSRPTLEEYQSEGRPLTVLLCWLMAKNNAVNKYAKFYVEKGYDVLTVRITPGQLLWPTRCTPIIDHELLPILQSSDHSQKLIHGFSVGGYVFAQMLKRFRAEPEKYRQLENSMFAQIWDSVVDVNGVSIGVSKSVFMNSVILQKSLQNYIDFHMKVFYSVATKYYDEAHEYFYNRPLKAPALFLCSTLDQISTIDVIKDVQNYWTPAGIKCINRVWNNTQHVGHMHKHPEEYKEAVSNFIRTHGGEPRQQLAGNVTRTPDEGIAGAFNLNQHVVYSK
jgi:hypothetical protein